MVHTFWIWIRCLLSDPECHWWCFELPASVSQAEMNRCVWSPSAGGCSQRPWSPNGALKVEAVTQTLFMRLFVSVQCSDVRGPEVSSEMCSSWLQSWLSGSMIRLAAVIVISRSITRERAHQSTNQWMTPCLSVCASVLEILQKHFEWRRHEL